MPARGLTEGEKAIARGVFGDAVDLDRVRIARRRGGRFAFVIGSRIAFPPEAPADFADQPLWRQAWLVHELTHVWQFQTRPLWAVASWLKVLATGGYGRGLRGYVYDLPIGAFETYNLEQQARLVEHAFLAAAGEVSSTMPEGAQAEHYLACSPFASGPAGVSTRA
jgi:hypothetical protein